MRFLSLLSLIALSVCGVSAEADTAAGKYDVCVIGGGAYGMSSAVFAKDRGYSVLVLDSANQVGGHCDTYQQTVPVPQGLDDWIDFGVQYFPDTKLANVHFDGSENGRWKIDTATFFRRFVGQDGIRYMDFTNDTFHSATYLADINTQTVAGPFFKSPPTPAFLQAYGKLNHIVTVQYPFLDTGFLDGPVPAELLVPFFDFINNNSLQPLISFLRPLLFNGGLGQFKNITTFFALRNLAPTILYLFSTPFKGFGVIGGCQRFYDGMVSYLGNDNVKVNATVTCIKRPADGEDSNDPHPIHIRGILSNIGQKHRRGPYAQPDIITSNPFNYKCGTLVLGLPQIPSNHARIGLDVDDTERSLWASMTARGYYDGLIDVTGGISNISINRAYMVETFNPLNQPTLDPSYETGWVAFQRRQPIPGSPSTFLAYSQEGPLPEQDIQIISQQQLNQLPKTLVDTANLLDVTSHIFQAHPSNEDLARTDGWYNAVRNIQGRRRTIWGGASVNYASHHILLNDAQITIERVLPIKQ